MENILDRINKLAEIEDTTITALEREIGASKGVLSRAIHKNTDIQSKWLIKIVENYPQYDPRWIISGELPMKRKVNIEKMAFEEEEVTYRRSGKTSGEIISQQHIPLYNLEASAGLVSLFSDSQSYDPVDFLHIPNLPKSDGAIYVTGDSMYPLLKSGDIIIYKKISNGIEGIFWGEMYLISVNQNGDEMTTVKWIQRSELGTEYIKLVSQNKHHQPKDIHISYINAIALIKASVRINSMS